MLQYMENDRALLAKKDEQILKIEEQIFALEQKLNELRAARHTLQMRLQMYKYPVLSLPNEIVAEIFGQFLPTYPTPPESRGTLSPTNLTQICRQWREIALGIPSLWRAIKLFPHPKSHSTAALWAQRSASCPLSIDAVHVQSLSVLLPHRLRWEHLSLGLRLDRFEGGSLPLLRSLQLSTDYCHYPAKIDNAPLLRKVFIRGFDADKITLPWERLTTLSVTQAYASTWLPILQQTPQLVHCVLQLRVQYEYDQPYDSAHAPEIPLLRLESLEFECRDKRLREFLHHLVVPSLRFLKLDEDLLGMNKPFSPLRSLLSNWNCTIEDLRINNSVFTEASYRTEFPSIKHVVCGDLPLHAFVQCDYISELVVFRMCMLGLRVYNARTLNIFILRLHRDVQQLAEATNKH
ncbi:F-box domain-containing protein [Favolaschia claudopus]|uniref:F-box domain-containing protein n=1 Tax=Favolaschia claudopus TaxID=2862362 RepID=A0AAW0DMB5_9AGAR